MSAGGKGGGRALERSVMLMNGDRDCRTMEFVVANGEPGQEANSSRTIEVVPGTHCVGREAERSVRLAKGEG